jgi:hypothetical protein
MPSQAFNFLNAFMLATQSGMHAQPAMQQ